MTGYDTARANMIDGQLRPNKVVDQRVLDAFATIRRELFVPEPLRPVAYLDDDLPLGSGRYLVQPVVTARLLQAAAIRRGDTILIVGAGSGYEAALGACLARFVVAVEEDAGIARRARAALVEHGIAAATVVEGPLAQGHKPRAPYDVILCTGALGAMPPEITGQLADGGRMPAVVRANGEVGHATLYTRVDGVLSHRIMFDAATPLLPGLAAKSAFVF